MLTITYLDLLPLFIGLTLGNVLTDRSRAYESSVRQGVALLSVVGVGLMRAYWPS